MSSEAWSSDSPRPARLCPCAHAIPIANLQDPSSSSTCPVCGCKSAYEREACLDYVPSQELSWPEAECIKAEPLTAPENANGSWVSGVEELAWFISAPGKDVLHVSPSPGNQRQPGADQATAEQSCDFKVWRARSCGSRVVGGTITIGPRGVLLLTGNGAHFTDTTFSGGAVMCVGPEFSGTFQRCKFNACSLYIVHGASVAVCASIWRNCDAAIIAHGAHTAAVITSCAAVSGFGIIVEAGAAFAADSVDLFCTRTAIAVNGPGSHFSAVRCGVHGSHTVSRAAAPPAWLHMHGGAASIRQFIVEEKCSAAVVRGATASLEIHSSIIKCPAAVAVSDLARVALVDTHLIFMAKLATGRLPDVMVDAESDQGLGSGGDGARARSASVCVTRCEFTGPSAAAVWIGHACRASIAMCRMNVYNALIFDGEGIRAHVAYCVCEAERASCLVGGKGTTVRLIGGELSAPGCACIIHAECTVSLVDLRLGGRPVPQAMFTKSIHQTAVTVGPAAAVSLVRCHICEGSSGVSVNQGHLRAVDVRIDGIRSSTVVTEPGNAPTGSFGYTLNGGHHEVIRGLIHGCDVGLGMTSTAAHACTTLRMHGVALEAYAQGVQVTKRCRADVTSCEFRGHAGMSAARKTALRNSSGNAEKDTRVGLGFFGAAGGSVRDCTFLGNGNDLKIQCDEPMTVSNCTFGGEWDVGFGQSRTCVTAYTPLELDACNFTGDGSCAVATKASDADVTLRKCTLTGNIGAGCVAARGAKITVLDSELRATYDALLAMGGGSVAAQDCTINCGRHAFCMQLLPGMERGGGVITAKRVTARGEATAVYIPLDAGASLREMKLVDCKLSGADFGVRVSGANALCSLLRCEVTSAEHAGMWADHGSCMRVRKTMFSGNKSAAFVGHPPAYDARCQLCGRNGPDGMAHAWRTVKAVGGDPEREARARCVHEGARATVVFEDVEVQGCVQLGVVVSAHGVLDARRMHVGPGRAAASGMSVEQAAGLPASTFEDCTVGDSRRCIPMTCVVRFGPGQYDYQGLGVPEGVEVV